MRHQLPPAGIVILVVGLAMLALHRTNLIGKRISPDESISSLKEVNLLMFGFTKASAWPPDQDPIAFKKSGSTLALADLRNMRRSLKDCPTSILIIVDRRWLPALDFTQWAMAEKPLAGDRFLLLQKWLTTRLDDSLFPKKSLLARGAAEFYRTEFKYASSTCPNSSVSLIGFLNSTVAKNCLVNERGFVRAPLARYMTSLEYDTEELKRAFEGLPVQWLSSNGRASESSLSLGRKSSCLFEKDDYFHIAAMVGAVNLDPVETSEDLEP